MTAMQRFAWFNLAVIGMTAILVVGLWPILGDRAAGGFGVLGLLGLGVFFFRRQPGRVVMDERDAVIQQRSWALAGAVLWILLGAGAGTIALIYEDQGSIPFLLSRWLLPAGFMIVYGVWAIAILFQYARSSGGEEHGVG